jgi:hypothetical protein
MSVASIAVTDVFWELLGLRMFKPDRLLSNGARHIPLDNGSLSIIMESLDLVFL